MSTNDAVLVSPCAPVGINKPQKGAQRDPSGRPLGDDLNEVTGRVGLDPTSSTT